ncbi:TraR/DksA C4-type zinc finger protein [Shewanella waksmanii]|uniref:TraR/DksA C4-type zinc finger protein n=1 Tax=Shewanella waksmanii TaxID=213783 RepID=UPI00049089E6|nr:TraR/DksA C4-type zinc finger protein [Shewanella waksmanii]
MNNNSVRQVLSEVEADLRADLERQQISQLGSLASSATISELIEILTQLKRCDDPLFIQLTKLDAAYCQLDIGMYGLCADCESEIESHRLQQDPLEQRCAACSAEFYHQHRQELRLTH